MYIARMKTNRMTNPLGFALGKPSLSWTVEEASGKKQQWARVEVAADPMFSKILWDSGEADLSSIDCPLPLTLSPRTRYWWRVTVCADNGETAVSEAAWFETGKMDEPFAGEWITPSLEKDVHPLMRRIFSLPEKPVSARVYGVGLGLYELSVNGEKAGNEFLAPGCTACDKWVQRQTYDVTELLRAGENTLGAMLGNGWVKGRFGFGGEPGNFETCDPGTPREVVIDRFLLRLELRVTFADGREWVLGTDESWQCAPAPVLMSSIYDGELYDQRRELAGWDTPEGDDLDWLPVEKAPMNRPVAEPEDRLSLPVTRHETFTPTLLHTEKGEWVLDFGQVISGWVEMDVDLPKDALLRLQYGELLQDGCFYRDNLRSAQCEYRFVSDGRAAHLRPHFTFYGFRYVKVTGWPGEKPDPNAFTACALYSDLEEIGTLETGNEKVNRLILNARWSQKDNFVDVPTDCPQRDERMGWTGDAQIFCSTAGFVMDCAAFYDKFCRDMWEEQKVADGCVPHVAPLLADLGEGARGACGWADAGVIVPWNAYLYNGGVEKLRQHFPAMRAWLEWLRREDASTGNTRLRQVVQFHYGDWLALDGPRYGLDPEAVMGGTDMTYLCSVYYFRCAQIVSKAAGILGETELCREYDRLAGEIREAIQREYFTATGRCAAATQTGLVLALQYDLVPEGFVEKNLHELQEMLKGANMHLKTGFLGTPVLCRALSKHGDSQSAYTLLLQEDLPSWLYEVNMGATTIWERWNSVLPNGKISGTGMNSMNHYAYGSIVEWMYRDMCGLNPVEACPGFAKVELSPKPDARLGKAFASVNTPAGRYESGWEAVENGFAYRFAVPFNGEAHLVLENVSLDRLTVNGVAAAEAGISAQQEGNRVTAILPAGSYVIQ